MMHHTQFMKTIFSVSLLLACLGAIAQNAPGAPAAEEKPKADVAIAPVAKKWTCTAETLAEFRYDGGDWARIRLAAYSSSGSYKVSKDQTGNIATGVTADRTPFVCTNK